MGKQSQAPAAPSGQGGGSGGQQGSGGGGGQPNSPLSKFSGYTLLGQAAPDVAKDFWNTFDQVSPLGIGGSPDYGKAAEQTAQENQQQVREQTAANRPNQSTPFAQSEWYQGPDGKWYQRTSMSPLAQGVYDKLGALDLNSLPGLDFGDAARQKATDAAYAQATSRLDPQWDKRQEAQRTLLLNQGLDPTSEASGNAQQRFDQGRNDAYGSAMNWAVDQGQSAADQAYRQSLGARQQGLAEMLKQRGLGLEDLQGFSGLLGMPNVPGAGVAPGTNYSGAVGNQSQDELTRRQMKQKEISDIVQGGGDIVGNLMKFLSGI